MVPGMKGENNGLLTPGSVGNSPKPVKPTRPSEHASSPSPLEGLIATPAGSFTVMPLIADCARPVGLSCPSWGTCTSTFRPAGLAACCTSGVTLICGTNGRRLQPTSDSLGVDLP